MRQLTNASGAVTDSYEYDAYGNLLNSTGTTPNAYMYRGEAYDSDLGLYYLRARWMNPLSGRFMSRDPNRGNPYDPATLHKYLYANGDPVDGFDPTGLGFVENISIRVYIFTQVTVPAYINGVGVVQFWGGLGALAGVVVGAACDIFEIAEWLEYVEDYSKGQTPLGGKSSGCDTGTHPGEGGPGDYIPPVVPPGWKPDPY